MTIVVAVRKDGQTALATNGGQYLGDEMHDVDNQTSEEILRAGNALLGLAGWGNYRVAFRSFLRSLETKPTFSDDVSVLEFFVRFWTFAQEKLHFVNDQSDKESPFADLDASFLVAASNHLFHVTPTMSVIAFERYAATGSGREYALGALRQLYEGGGDASGVARAAAETAAHFDTSCLGEIQVGVL